MIENPCPECGGETESWPTCHTWTQSAPDGTERWMSCMSCDSATDWYCLDCNWIWTQGLNPRNPRAEANAACAPPWGPS